MIHKYLYDNEEQFYPMTEASAVMGGVVIQGNTVWQDLEQIWAKAQSAYNNSTGATQIKGSLGIQVFYTNTDYNDDTRIQSETIWNATMTIPTASTPYTWKKTVYSWSDAVIKTTYEICATALYPETQTMYTAITSIQQGSLQGPTNYGNSSADKNPDCNAIWKNYFTGIDASKIYGYMAVRHREAGEAWPEDGGWNIALFAQYPISE